MLLIIGLRNPEKRYNHSPHNIGEQAINYLYNELQAQSWQEQKKLHATIAKAHHEELGSIILALPTVYMNNSGRTVAAIQNYYNITPAETIVLYDDIETAIGKIKYKKEGSASGHNGLRDIIQQTGTLEFPRVRIGVMHQPKTIANIADYVLTSMPGSDEETIKKTFPDILPLLLKNKASE